MNWLKNVCTEVLITIIKNFFWYNNKVSKLLCVRKNCPSNSDLPKETKRSRIKRFVRNRLSSATLAGIAVVIIGYPLGSPLHWIINISACPKTAVASFILEQMTGPLITSLADTIPIPKTAVASFILEQITGALASSLAVTVPSAGYCYTKIDYSSQPAYCTDVIKEDNVKVLFQDKSRAHRFIFNIGLSVQWEIRNTAIGRGRDWTPPGPSPFKKVGPTGPSLKRQGRLTRIPEKKVGPYVRHVHRRDRGVW